MVKTIIQKGVRGSGSLLFKNQQTIFSGAVVIAVMLLLSAILGLVKKRLYFSIIGIGPELDAFFLASRPTDIVFQLLIGGAINAAFIPIFSSLIRKKDKDASWQFVSSVINGTIILFVLFSVVFFFLARPLSHAIAPGFEKEQIDTLVRLIRIFLLSPIILGISSFIAGTLQSFRHFFLPFLSPIVYNLGGILGVVVLYPGFGIEGAAWGVVIGAVGHLLIQIPLIRYVGFKYSFQFDWKEIHFQDMLRLAIPRSIGAGVEQVKTLILFSFGSLLAVGSISFFEFGLSITNIAINMFGVSIAQASLPHLAELFAENKIKALNATFMSSFNQILFFIMPVNVILIILKIPVVRLIYGAEGVTWEQTVMTAWVVAFLGISLFAQALSNLMIRFYYALHETRLPVILGAISMIVSIIVAAVLVAYVPELGVRSLAIAVSAGALIEFGLLLMTVIRKYIHDWKKFLETPVKILIASAVMAAVIYIPVQVLDQVFIDTSRVVNLLILMWLVVSFGLTIYLVLTWILGVKELKVVFMILIKVKEFRENLQVSFRTPEIVSSTLYEEVDDQDL